MRSTLEQSRAAAIRSAFRHAARRLLQRAKPARAGIASLMSVVAVLYSPQAAEANQVTATITGTVRSGTDVTGVFVRAGANLAGYPFSLVYIFDDSKGKDCGAIYSCIENSGYDDNPVTRTVLTINEIPLSMDN
jgi:hypothetical protein